MTLFEPPGWLDIHAHFQLPISLEEAQKRISYYHQAKFMVDSPVLWNADEVLQYNDTANIQMQMLSCIPVGLEDLKRTNDYGHRLVQEHPTRFGLLAALPTDNADACLEEIVRTYSFKILPDGFAVTTFRDGCYLSDARLDVVWQELNKRKAVVHIHPSATSPPNMGRPVPLIEVAFDTTRTVVDMIYNRVMRHFPDIKFVLAHCGGALPVLSGRLALLGTESWVPNSQGITKEDINEQLASLYVDTAATAKTGLEPALRMCGANGCIYGSDCGVPCSTVETLEENRRDVIEFEEEAWDCRQHHRKQWLGTISKGKRSRAAGPEMLTVSTLIKLAGHIHLFTLDTATQNTAPKVHINDRSYRSCIEETTDLC